MIPNIDTIVSRFARRNLFSCPSPIQRLYRVEKHLDKGIEIYSKRDDLLRPFFGNKLRYLEYVLGDYDVSGSDCLIHSGSDNSNYMAQIAMIGAQEDIPVHLILRGDDKQKAQGNSLLGSLYGASITYKQSNNKITNSFYKRTLAKQLRGKGKNPYVIDFPFSNYSAIVGYIRAYSELRTQISQGLLPDPDYIFLCSGGNSYLGLQIAADLFGDRCQIVAFPPDRFQDSGLTSVSPNRDIFLLKKVQEFSQLISMEISTEVLNFDETYVGEGYGIPSQASVEAVRLLASMEGILLDPIYSGKAMAGVIERILSGQIPTGSRILFIHTGGWANVFTFHQAFSN